MRDGQTASESATMTCVRVFEPLELLRARYTRQRFAPHAHDEYVFGVVEDGAARTIFRGGEDIHAVGSIITFSPGEVHTGAPATEDGWSYRMLYPSESLVRFVAREATGRDFAPTFEKSFAHDPVLSARLFAAHATLEGNADRLQKEEALLETLGELIIRHASTVDESSGVLPGTRC